jgi:hypothetical protein
LLHISCTQKTKLQIPAKTSITLCPKSTAQFAYVLIFFPFRVVSYLALDLTYWEVFCSSRNLEDIGDLNKSHTEVRWDGTYLKNMIMKRGSWPSVNLMALSYWPISCCSNDKIS